MAMNHDILVQRTASGTYECIELAGSSAGTPMLFATCEDLTGAMETVRQHFPGCMISGAGLLDKPMTVHFTLPERHQVPASDLTSHDALCGMAAIQRLRNGRTFFTSETAADVAGYGEDDEAARERFILGYREEFRRRWPSGVRVDHNGRIVE